MSILATLNQTCDRYAQTTGANGLPGYGGSATTSGIKCRVEPAARELRRDQDTVILLTAVIFAGPGNTFADQDKLVVGSQSYIVEEIQTMRGLSAISHYELLSRGI